MNPVDFQIVRLIVRSLTSLPRYWWANRTTLLGNLALVGSLACSAALGWVLWRSLPAWARASFVSAATAPVPTWSLALLLGLFGLVGLGLYRLGATVKTGAKAIEARILSVSFAHRTILKELLEKDSCYGVWKKNHFKDRDWNELVAVLQTKQNFVAAHDLGSERALHLQTWVQPHLFELDQKGLLTRQ